MSYCPRCEPLRRPGSGGHPVACDRHDPDPALDAAKRQAARLCERKGCCAPATWKMNGSNLCSYHARGLGD